MNPAQSEDYSLLLTVFSRGLRNGLVSKAEVVKWADDIILTEDDPDYFFIELSLASNINQLLNIISTTPMMDEPVVGRILLGLLYWKTEKTLIDARRIVSILDEINTNDNLSSEERGDIYQLSDEFDNKFGMKIFEEWEADVSQFLSNYKSFTIDNFTEWQRLNDTLEAKFKAMCQERRRQYEISVKQNRQKVNTEATAIRITLALVVLFALFVIIITYLQLQNHQYLTKFQTDLYSICIWVDSLFICYQIVKVIYKGMWKLVKNNL